MFRLAWLLLDLATKLLRTLASLPRQASDTLRSGDREVDRKRLVAVGMLACGSAWLAASILPRVTLVMSPSIDAWVLRSSDAPIRKGDLVQFVLAHPVAGPEPVSVTKYALCMPGDQVQVMPIPSQADRGTTAEFYCSGTFLGKSLSKARGGLMLSPARIAGIVPPGFVYVGSSHPQGFDSRYFGLVPIARLRRMERLI